MTLDIAHYPGLRFDLCAREFNVDIHTAITEKLQNGAQLTNATALKILKEIKWKSDVLSFLTKPVVALCLSTVVIVAGFCIPAVGTALFAARVFVCGLGGGMMGFSIENSLRGFLPALSDAYGRQSEIAANYIGEIERAKQEVTFTFA